MYQVSLSQGAESSLGHADVTLHSTQEHSIPVTGKTFERGAEDITAEAGEHMLVNGLRAGQQRRDFRNRIAKTFGVLGGHYGRHLQNSRHANEHLRIANQLLLLKNRRKKFFLDVHYQQNTALRFESKAGNLGVIGVVQSSHIANGADHE